MKLYIIKINGIDVYKTEAISKIKAFDKIKQNLPDLLSYPHFWCLACCPNKIPMTVPEKIIFHSKPYRYYMAYRKEPDRAEKIETNRGYYFHGENIIKCMKNINYLVTASDSESSDSDFDESEDLGYESQTDKIVFKKLKRNKKRKDKKMRLMGNIFKTKKIKLVVEEDNESLDSSFNSSSESESESEPDDEDDILQKQMICYFKKYMTLEVFNRIVDSDYDSEEDSFEFIIKNIESNKSSINCVSCFRSN